MTEQLLLGLLKDILIFIGEFSPFIPWVGAMFYFMWLGLNDIIMDER